MYLGTCIALGGKSFHLAFVFQLLLLFDCSINQLDFSKKYTALLVERMTPTPL